MAKKRLITKKKVKTKKTTLSKLSDNKKKLTKGQENEEKPKSNIIITEQLGGKDNRKEIYLRLYKQCAANISESCRALKISRTCFQDWRKEDTKFAGQCLEIEESMIDIAESKLMEQVTKGKGWAVCYYLNNKGKRRGWQQPNKMVLGELVVDMSDEIAEEIQNKLKERYE